MTTAGAEPDVSIGPPCSAERVQALLTERDHLRLLFDVTNAAAATLDLPGIVEAVSSALERAIPHELAALALNDEDSGYLVVHAAASKSGDGRRYVGKRFADTAAAAMREAGIRSVCAMPLVVGDRGLGMLIVGNLEPGAFTPASVATIEEVARQVAMAITNALAFREIGRLMERLADVEVIPGESLEALRRYAWPWNVRELANLVARAMILSKGHPLDIPLAELKPRRPRAEHYGAKTLEAVERMHILRVLKETNWTLGGPRGAAARLGMKRTTLQSLMKRLGITRPRAA